MAEVSQRLGNGAYRLTAFRTSQGRLAGIGVSPECHSISKTSSQCHVKEELVEDERGVQSRLRSRAARGRAEKLPKVRKAENQDDVTPRCATSLDLASSSFLRFAETRDSLQACKTGLYLSAGLPLEKQCCRMSPWTRVVPIHPVAPQQRRAFCTVVFILPEQVSDRLGCGSRLRRLKLHPETVNASTIITRGYSWRSEEASLLHRSKTAYYDILKVSPSATQSQIKTAYYKQSFIYHPDKNPGNKEATQRFSEISEAYTVLGNISLRRKYDRGILNQSDVQSAGRPSSKETKSKSTGSQQQQQQRARKFSQTGGKTMFDFDAFYRAHYGEQLQREREIRARKQQMQEMQQQKQSQWREQKMMELALTVVMAMAGLIFVSLSKP